MSYQDGMGEGLPVIYPKFNKLITTLRTVMTQENPLDKKTTYYDDILDAYQPALKN
jgi:hypothetical protein